MSAIPAAPAPADLRWPRRARWLALATIAWNVIESGVSIGFGAAEESLALFGFGVDAAVEVGSAAVVLWALGPAAAGCATTRRQVERRATKVQSALFLVLAASMAAGALAQLAAGAHPASTVPGIVISAISLGFMGFLWRAKVAAAAALDSATLRMDAACARACLSLSAVLLAGSAVAAVAPGAAWADAVATLGLAALVGREGASGWAAARKADFAGGCGCAG